MVYCGKASQGCQNCRTRRIKCDKVKPECSQCIRVGKKCPGYRDQLSLMFRDESTKVIKKAHAQWGVAESSENGSARPSASVVPSPPSSSPAYSRKSTPTSVLGVSRSERPAVTSSPTASPVSSYRSTSAGSTSPITLPAIKQEHTRETSPLCIQVASTLEQQGLRFYVNRYLLGHPDEPKSHQDLATEAWVWHPALQDVMSAVGLAGLYNLTGNVEMMAMAREKYGSALRQTGQLIRPPHTPSIDVTMRAVVALAMFEVVKGTHHSTGTVHAHVMGGAALMRSWCPMPSVPFSGFRALLQLCYSMFIPLHVADLAIIIASFVEISSFVHNHVISDGKPKTVHIIQRLLDLEIALAGWAAGLTGEWEYRVIHAAHLPPKAVFQGQYHKYHDVWTARIWNYYRWARILVIQTLLDLANQNPSSSLSLLSAFSREKFLKTIQELSKDILVSAPTHWRHPILDETAQVTVESPGGGGAGSAGLPALLFHLKVAGCAPGVPKVYWEWSMAVIQTIWGDMGMLHARSMMEAMRAHADTVHRTGAAGILADDW